MRSVRSWLRYAAAMRVLVVLVAIAVACSHSSAPPLADAADPDSTVEPDAPAVTGCATGSGQSGTCMATTDCAAMVKHISVPGVCPGPANIQCCVMTPSVADNPPVPAGWKLMMQASVTPSMTTWAVMILHEPVTYPMFATAMMTFGTLPVLARVEWHPPDFNNSTIHRGVTLYEPAP